MKVGFTEKVIETFKERGVYSPELLQDIANKVISIPRVGYEMDTSDDGISVAEENISFLRDWQTGQFVVMTNEEAAELITVKEGLCEEILMEGEEND